MFKIYDLKTFNDAKGSLTPVELKDFIDFDVKRFYTVFNNLTKRGGHAHKDEKEFFMMTSGSCVCKLHDGKQWHEIRLEQCKNAIYVGNLIWHEFDDFSDSAVLVALSSTNYNPNRQDYIEDFDKFLNYVQ